MIFEQIMGKMETTDDGNTVQQALLEKLLEYGDSLMDIEDYEKRKTEAVLKKKMKNHKKEKQFQDIQKSLESSKELLSGSKLKKRKKLLKNGNNHEAVRDVNSDESSKKRRGRMLREFEEELRVFKEAKESEPFQSKTEVVVEEISVGQKVIVFDDSAKRKKVKLHDSFKSPESNFDLNKARLEVEKFGLSGFDYADRKKYEQERAIKLGAKPPKRDYVNYKLYMEQLKVKRAEEMKQKDIDQKLGLQVSSSKSSDKNATKIVVRKHGFWRDRSLEKGFQLGGQLGIYRPGVLSLTGKDITKVTGKSRGKSKKKKTKSHSEGQRTKTTKAELE